MRHGPAEDHAPTGRDEDRALTSKGRDRVRSVARWLVEAGELPGRILTSRLVRAAQTGEIVSTTAAGTGKGPGMEVAGELAPGGHGLALVRRLHAAADHAPMLVGHEPDLSSLVERLLGESMPVPMDKGMVVALELGKGDSAKLRFILEPRGVVILHDRRGERGGGGRGAPPDRW